MGREVAVDCVIMKDGKVLLLKRAHEPFNGYWVLPGGHVESNESVEDAAVREMREELGLDVEIGRLIGVFSDPHRDPRGLVSVAFLARAAGGDVQLNREASEYAWFPLDELPENIGFDHKEILEGVRCLLKLKQA
ncbi:MAG: NUDIX hydrolase [Candidatus Diapherotrites archaeon]|nr:NUDIX hydrolase [Candidatus Diapherotrites archaeon]